MSSKNEVDTKKLVELVTNLRQELADLTKFIKSNDFVKSEKEEEIPITHYIIMIQLEGGSIRGCKWYRVPVKEPLLHKYRVHLGLDRAEKKKWFTKAKEHIIQKQLADQKQNRRASLLTKKKRKSEEKDTKIQEWQIWTELEAMFPDEADADNVVKALEPFLMVTAPKRGNKVDLLEGEELLLVPLFDWI
jgi:hypothetical protein